MDTIIPSQIVSHDVAWVPFKNKVTLVGKNPLTIRLYS